MRGMDRRRFLAFSGLALAGSSTLPGFLKRALAAAPAQGGKVLVALFQRGAVDGLSMVPPLGEPRYAALRPSIAIAAKGDGAALPLDGFFGLHPALRPLMPLWSEGSLAIVHAAGSPDATRSHFDAQDYLDAGTPGVKSTPDGWLNRAEGAVIGEPGPLAAVALQGTMPRSLAGKARALAFESLSDVVRRAEPGRASSAYAEMYAGAEAALSSTFGETADALRVLREARPDRLAPANGAVYPASPLGRRLQDVARLVRAGVGLRVAATDCGGWDTHAAQGAAAGPLANRLGDLAAALAAFRVDLGERWSDVCLVTMTEFGRTVRENGTRGTDHGHGSVMLVMGGGVKGRRVLARWKGLADGALFEGRDLAVTTDHREVLSEVLARHLAADTSHVFPGFSAAGAAPGLFA